MRIGDSFTCEFRQDRSWTGKETSTVELWQQEQDVALAIETQQVGPKRRTRNAAELEVSRIGIDTIRRAHDMLGDWLQADSCESDECFTQPVEGTYEDSSGKMDVAYLRIELTAEGWYVHPLGESQRPAANSIRVPATHEVHDGEAESFDYLKRLYSILTVFLAGADTERRNLLRNTGYLIDQDIHLHPDIQQPCLTRLANEDYMGVIQAAATALEEALRDGAPDERAKDIEGATTLAQETFKKSDPVFSWGYEGGEQKGLMNLYKGAFQALRNPVSHRQKNPDGNRYLDDIDRRDALDALCLFNFLLRRLDRYGATTLEKKV